MSEPELLHSGKVRDVYLYEGDLLLVASDRVSAYDVILPSLLKGKGIALTQIARFWFDNLSEAGIGIPHHVKSFDVPEGLDRPDWKGRITVCHQAEVVKLECVVRGYLSGSGWKDYQKTGTVQGHSLPEGLVESDNLPESIFTPTTKAGVGDKDLPLTEAEARDHVGAELYEKLKETSLNLYNWAHALALEKGIIIADTKFEFGYLKKEDGSLGELVLIDEILTPDSSRFWPQDDYQPGGAQPSYDKQYVRDYLSSIKDWNQQPPGPELPAKIILNTMRRYNEACERLTGKPLDLPL